MTVPRTLGTLMTVFGGLGVVFGALGVFAGGAPPANAAPVWQTFASLNTAFGVLGIAISALELVAGLAVTRQSRRARKLALGYAALALASTVAWLVVVFAWLEPALGKADAGSAIGIGIVFSVLAGLVWPLAVILLMRRAPATTA
ncbi:MAG: hypothetical protein WKG01_38590 [Kofleriaceae bacterium]